MILKLKHTSIFGGLTLATAVALIGATSTVFAQVKPGDDFNLQVSPSPLVETLKPGTTTELELKVRNLGTGTEQLTIQPRDFDVDKRTGNITLLDTPPPIIKDWITFGNQTFTVRPGEVYTQKVKISLPKESGFSYSLTLVITRAGQDAKIESGAVYRGSVATFTLINVDRPGATRKFDVTNFKTTQGIYEYLPAEFDIDFRNTGNTIIQPVGNVFIHKGTGGGDPISVIPLNPARGYLLPDRPRTLDTTWTEGFPVYKTSRGADGQEKQDLVWDWSKISDFRIGQYTAKLVAVYNDGKRDIPIEKTVTFWVIPWRIILGSILVLIVFGVGVYVILRKSGKLIRRKKK